MSKSTLNYRPGNYRTEQGRGVAMGLLVTLALSLAIAAGPLSASAAEPATNDTSSATRATANEAATQLNELLLKEIAATYANEGSGSATATNSRITRPTRIADITFLRRVYLDLVGAPPTPAEIEAFMTSDQTNKRQLVVDQLLADRRYGQNWANYWRDVILARRSDQRQLGQVSASVERYLTRALNNGRGWDKIARDFITAKGNIRKQGDTALIFLQQGKAAETASEVSRVFLGIQISCAQCHDHPTDHWKREQFHELAAFFPRTRVRREFIDGRRTFKLVGQDRGPRKPKGNKKNGRKRPPIEHFMPELDDPAADGTQMTPTFFVNGKTLPLGTPDAERRSQLATWITEPANPWFARAYVNRIWAELVGWGFYEPVDDLGPEREADAPETLDYLAAEFVRNGHDMKWLFRTITATDAYGRASRSRDPSGEKQLLASHAQPLRGDALFDSLAVALNLPGAVPANKLPPLAPLTPLGDGSGGDEGEAMEEMEMPEEMTAEMPRKRKGPRNLFRTAFGYDPSLPREDLKGSIPQALAMMNAPQIQNHIRASKRRSLIRKITAEHDDAAAIVTQLYLHCLARAPGETELQTCLEYIETIDNRDEALEDIQWSLINSTEFRHRR